MPCYFPLKGWLASDVNGSGKRSVVFKKSEALCAAEVSIPCGQCIGCRLERARQWAVRCVHEASLYEDNCFITLTFDDQFLDKKGSLVKKDFQKFLKRLRKRVGKFRYFHCGEYGDKGKRPHHHACIFGWRPDDLVLFKENNGVRLYTSKLLEECWPFGFVTVGDVTYDSAAYVARYCTKKVNFNKIHPEVQARHYGDRIPEYTTMSRRPGIARRWYDRFKSDVYPTGVVTMKGGLQLKPPEYYERLFELDNKEVYDKIKMVRARRAFNSPDNTPDRLRVREDIKIRKLRELKRSVENDA